MHNNQTGRECLVAKLNLR